MGIFERLIDAFESGISEFVDGSENPDKAVKQVIADVQKELKDTVQKYNKTKTTESFANKKYQEALKISEEWADKARQALSQADRELAKHALARKIKADEDAEGYKEVYESVSEQVKSLKKQIELLKNKLNEAETKQAVIDVKSQAVGLMKEIAKSVVDLEKEDFDRFKRTGESAPKKTGKNISTDNKVESQEKTADEILDIDAEFEKLMAELKDENNNSDDKDI